MTLRIAAGSTLLFIGDSITEWGRDDATGSIGHGYVRMVADAWATAHPEHPVTVVNKGIGGDRASDLLRTRGFRVAVVGDHPYPGIPGGIVLRQNPQAGFQISPGETISLEISR